MTAAIDAKMTHGQRRWGALRLRGRGGADRIMLSGDSPDMIHLHPPEWRLKGRAGAIVPPVSSC